MCARPARSAKPTDKKLPPSAGSSTARLKPKNGQTDLGSSPDLAEKTARPRQRIRLFVDQAAESATDVAAGSAGSPDSAKTSSPKNGQGHGRETVRESAQKNSQWDAQSDAPSAVPLTASSAVPSAAKSVSKDPLPANSQDYIVIRGARQHNLKNINVNIPRNSFTVISGLSGSGKSSLAFDTLYAEGQRRYVESLSSYARQFLGQMDKPDVDLIEGLSPAISIEQKTTSKNPRSTVGTVTEIYDYIRLLYARIGRAHCHKCGRPISSQSPVEIVDRLMSLESGSKIMLLAPLVDSRKGEHQKLFDKLRKDGFVRVRIGGEIKDLTSEIVLDKKRKHAIEAVVDRLTLRPGLERRLTDSVESALRASEGSLIVILYGEDNKPIEELYFSERFACDHCGLSFPELTPQLFSFNAPQGACPKCDGLGANLFFDPDLIITDRSLSLIEGAVAYWSRTGGYYFSQLECVFRHYGWDSHTPLNKLPQKAIDVILNGTGRQNVGFEFERDGQTYVYHRPFEGILKNMERRWRESESQAVKDELEEYITYQPCPDCGGARLRPEALAVTVAGVGIKELCDLTIARALDFFIYIELSDRDLSIARRIVKEIRERLGFLNDVGLGYLSLSRGSATLSGGETQRIRLATQIGSKLVGVMYVLDEPSIGLHQRDNEKLLASLKRMRDLGNTVIVVEHDAETIMSADVILDMGPGAGEHGGHLVFEGSPDKLVREHKTLTGQYLAGLKEVGEHSRRRLGDKALVLKGAKGNNLKNIDATFPLGVLTCVTGVSGSGKSTLVLETLYKAMAQKISRSRVKPAEHSGLIGLENVDKVIDIDQSPIGRTPRSNPATYTGIFTPIRELFSHLPDARARGYQPGRFSFNVKGGRCEKCQGDGIIKIEMHFLPDVYVRCETCQGLRYNRDTLEIKYNGASIADVLNMTVSEAATFFENIPALRDKLLTLQEVGLGYVRLGQSATTLSGGEAQRVKLSKELSRRDTGRTMYILDEPTTGLHFDDVKKLLEVLQRLVGQGNTVIVIEHNLDIVKNADHIIDLGPEGGEGGGLIVASGSPEEVAANPKSHTGRFLKKILKGHKS
ncbi:MAG: excinuclease ABC subunit UvrA [Deltaproteobacteria bacterium]|jgi:excinuclease ABC subunit A|nr:excinuclease ABC subunit UvrA [Deltaproteobacteria bacterium]